MGRSCLRTTMARPKFKLIRFRHNRIHVVGCRTIGVIGAVSRYSSIQLWSCLCDFRTPARVSFILLPEISQFYSKTSKIDELS